MRVSLQSLIGFPAALLLSTFQCVAQGPSTSFDVAQAAPRSGPTEAAAGEQGRAAAVNNWTVGIAGGFFEGTFIRFAAELAKALDDDDNLRILPIVTITATNAVSTKTLGVGWLLVPGGFFIRM